MANEKLLSLHSLTNVNTVISMLYDANGVYRAGFDPNVFYNTILIDSLKYGEENYVHLKSAESLTIRRGDTVARFRRWAGLTPTLTPLREGIPPAPDKHAYETIEVGNVFSFGRWSEYTDKLDLSIINEVLAERSVQYGEVANQTKELYARKTWLATPNEFFANFKAGVQELAFGDEIRLDDLRFLVARMKRMMVKPVGGKFMYVCSPEFINGLIDDPRVKQYMEIEQTTGKLWTTGQQFDMFELSFVPTMLDEFAYPDIEFPGVYESAAGHEVIRLYAMGPATTATVGGVTIPGNFIFYLDIHEGMLVKSGVTAKSNLAGTTYLKDGSAIEEAVRWEVPQTVQFTSWAAASPTGAYNALDINGSNAPTTATALLRKQFRYISRSGLNAGMVAYEPIQAGINTDVGTARSAGVSPTGVNALLDAGAFLQLPIHRGVLFGAEALVKLTMEGVSDSPKIIVKALGSSGVADPIDQRQSIGFKVDGFGLAIKRPEAVVVTFGIPRYAELAALTEKVVFKNYDPSFLTEAEMASGAATPNKILTDGSQALRVDGVNLGGVAGSPNVAGFNQYKFYATSTAYLKGDVVLQPIVISLKNADGTITNPLQQSTKVQAFVFKKDITSGANTSFAAIRAEYLKKFVDTVEADVLGGEAQGNEPGSNVE